MSTASDRIPLVGLSLSDAHAIADQLRTRSMALRALACDYLAEGGRTTDLPYLALDTERCTVLALREKLTAATTQTLAGLG